MEPVRHLRRNVTFHLAHATRVDLARRVVVAEVDATRMPGADAEAFELPYDRLVVACGAVANTFGIPGVREHAMFLKEVQDARAIRRRILDCSVQSHRGGPMAPHVLTLVSGPARLRARHGARYHRRRAAAALVVCRRRRRGTQTLSTHTRM
jgi:NADH dehydrogenase FAD-containing subunit